MCAALIMAVAQRDGGAAGSLHSQSGGPPRPTKTQPGQSYLSVA